MASLLQQLIIYSQYNDLCKAKVLYMLLLVLFLAHQMTFLCHMLDSWLKAKKFLNQTL